jgi:hypothetical protein
MSRVLEMCTKNCTTFLDDIHNLSDDNNMQFNPSFHLDKAFKL